MDREPGILYFGFKFLCYIYVWGMDREPGILEIVLSKVN